MDQVSWSLYCKNSFDVHSSEDNCLDTFQDFRMVGVCTAQIPLENIKVRKYQKNFYLSSNTKNKQRKNLQISDLAVFEEEKKSSEIS